MSELTFKSSLSMEEIENNFKDIDFFSGIMEGLEEAAAYFRIGEHKLRNLINENKNADYLLWNGNRVQIKRKASAETYVRKRSLPNVNVAEVRESLSMTQKAFASVLGVSCRTVEAWESGKSNPTPTAKKLMFLIQEDHALVERLQFSEG